MINDVSGLSDESVAQACAASGAALVITHTRVPPKTKAFPPYDDLVREVDAFLGERVERARSLGVGHDRIVLDPGIDLAKTPAQSIELLRSLPRFAARGCRCCSPCRARTSWGRSPAGAGRTRRRHAGRGGRSGARRRPHPARARRARGAGLPAGSHRAGRRTGRGPRAPSWPRQYAGRRYEHDHHRPALRPALRLGPLRAEPARPGAGRGQRAGARRGDRLRRPHRLRAPGRVPAGRRLPRSHRLRARDRDSRQPRFAQCRVRPLRGADGRAPLGAPPRGRRSWPSTPPSPTWTTA